MFHRFSTSTGQLTVNVPTTSITTFQLLEFEDIIGSSMPAIQGQPNPTGQNWWTHGFCVRASQSLLLLFHGRLHHVTPCCKNEEDREGHEQHTAPRRLVAQPVVPHCPPFGKPRRNLKASSWHLLCGTWKLYAGKLRTSQNRRGSPRCPRWTSGARSCIAATCSYSMCVETEKCREGQGA